MRFKIGEKVVCLPESEKFFFEHKALVAFHFGIDLKVPVPGGIYTIRGSHNSFDGLTTCSLLEEVVNPTLRPPFSDMTPAEPHFPDDLFAPVQERSTDAEVEKLKKLQDPANHQVFEQPRVLEVAG